MSSMARSRNSSRHLLIDIPQAFLITYLVHDFSFCHMHVMATSGIILHYFFLNLINIFGTKMG